MNTVPAIHARSLARVALYSFLGVFIASRVLVILIMTRTVPDLFVYLGGTHIHHLNYGIFLLSGVGGYLLFCRPPNRGLRKAAFVYGVAMALTYDEFGMWLHLGGSYWQRASWDAMGTIAALLALLAFAPSFSQLKPRHCIAALCATFAALSFLAMLWWSLRVTEQTLGPRLRVIELEGPR
jgi:hypothetical protein